MKRILKTIICLILATGLCVGAVATDALPQAAIGSTPAVLPDAVNASISASQKTLPDEKSEMVYVNLNADGTPREQIVTNILHSNKANALLSDSSELSEIRPIKGGQLVSGSSGDLVWQLEGNDLYYRGSTNRTLPIDVAIRYSLDGTEYPAAELAGKSGHLTIDLDIHNNCPQAVQVGGVSKTVYTPLSATVGMIFPDDIFSNVTVSDGGTAVGDGNRFIVGIVAMPGMKASLELTGMSLPEVDKLDFPEHFTVSADVKGFEMEPIAIAATTQFPDVAIATDFTDEMYKNLTDLQGMQKDLEAMDGDRQIRSLFTDSKNHAASQALVKDIYDFYDLDTDILEVIKRIVTPTNIDLADSIFDKLETIKRSGLLESQSVDVLLRLTQGNNIPALLKLADDLDTTKSTLAPGVSMLSDEAIDLMGGIAQSSDALLEAYAKSFGQMNMTPAELQTFVTAGMNAVAATRTTPFDIEYDVEPEAESPVVPAAPTEEVIPAESPVVPAAPAEEVTAEESPVVPAAPAEAVTEAESPVVPAALTEEVIPAESPVAPAAPAEEVIPVESPVAPAAPAERPSPRATTVAPETIINAARFLGGMQQMTATASSISPEVKSALQFGKALLSQPAQVKDMRNLLMGDFSAAAPAIEMLTSELEPQALTQLGAIPAMFAEDLKDVKALKKKIDPMLDDYDLLKLKREAPHTLSVLLTMKHDLENNRNISDILKKATLDENSNTFASIIATLDRLESEGAVDKYLAQTADLRKLIGDANTLSALGRQDIKYVMKTDTVKLPKAEPVMAASPVPQEIGLMEKLTQRFAR